MRTEEKRLALNEAMFREINERLEARLPVSHEGREVVSVLCECASVNCADRLSLTVEEYAQVRSDPRQFVVAPGHECVNVETVVMHTERYDIVRKTGVAGDVAELLEPPQSQ